MSCKVLVTGASGLVGANLIRKLLENGRDVRALIHSDRRGLIGLDVETVGADIRDPGSLVFAMRDVEIVYHLAGSISIAMDSGQEMEAVNSIGTRNVVAACLQTRVRRLIHFSSISALSQAPLDQPLDETRPMVDDVCLRSDLGRIPPYDRSKAQSEREVLAGMVHGLEVVILQPTAILGPFDFKPSYVGQALILLARGWIPALVPGGFDWVDVRDVVEGALAAEQSAPSGRRYLLGGRWHSIREVAELVAGETHRGTPILTVPLWLADAFAPMMLKVSTWLGSAPIYTRTMLRTIQGNRQVSHERADQELGYSTRPLSKTIRDTIAWFRENGYLGKRS